MSKTLLNGVNEVLKRVNVISGDSGALSSLTDSGKQTFIDIAVQVWNEALDELYSTVGEPKPQELAEDTITLATGTRAYTLNSAMNQLYYPLIDGTNGNYINEYPGGYRAMVNDQAFPANYTGLPSYGAIRETDGKFYLDMAPTATENGNVYTYRYDKDISLSTAANTFPFKDVVFRAMVPAVAELWKRDQRNSFDPDYFRLSIGRAARMLTQKQVMESWTPRKSYLITTDPYAD